VVHVFPEASLIADRKVLVVTSAWGTGRSVTTVRNKVTGADGEVYTCVLHFSHQRSLFTNEKPDFYAALTDAWIIYPWEIERGTDLIMKDLV
jgi:hypoxanthine phosphoribosyltransferase